MAERLSKGDSISSYETITLIRAEETWKSLHERLTWVFKKDQRGGTIELKRLFTELIDNFYTVLYLIRL